MSLTAQVISEALNLIRLDYYVGELSLASLFIILQPLR